MQLVSIGAEWTNQVTPWSSVASRSASQEFPNILWNQNVHYPINNIPPLVLLLCQINPAHTTISYFSKINFNIILSPTSRFSQWSLSFLDFPPKSYMQSSSPPMRVTYPAHLILLDLVILIVPVTFKYHYSSLLAH
jgi:hypothetical protein